MIQTLLFDWGNTLMVDGGCQPGPMSRWPSVASCPYIGETLALLRNRYSIALATNADDSWEDDIREALERVNLGVFVGAIYCSNRIGAKKPVPDFYSAILADLRAEPREVMMIGDSLENDVRAALRAGLCALWYAPGVNPGAVPEGIRAYRNHRELPGLLDGSR